MGAAFSFLYSLFFTNTPHSIPLVPPRLYQGSLSHSHSSDTNPATQRPRRPCHLPMLKKPAAAPKRIIAVPPHEPTQAEPTPPLVTVTCSQLPAAAQAKRKRRDAAEAEWVNVRGQRSRKRSDDNDEEEEEEKARKTKKPKCVTPN